MKNENDIFGSERGFGADTGISAVTITTLILSVISIAAAIFVIINFNIITAVIAMWVSELLASAIIILAVVAGILCLILSLSRGFRRCVNAKRRNLSCIIRMLPSGLSSSGFFSVGWLQERCWYL